ncbi:hypothetical protein ASF53_22170 [Methylobacterium sp. Leaf123]|uniref:hypothetical protein n=1 Tax=Methylobacterium sp. Leaf123 TaxID=1736264 RepID=UPI0006F5BC25|nr:hypothetical protein [Methylobacterium sp. Leaf123]KQQ25387.1 hypothetical protein ASF53_22170 [Methylobacterium sp. Leaf123]
MSVILAIALSVQSGAAMAQAITNVNECTFITDPIALRRCIDGFQLRGPSAQYPQSEPVPQIESPAQAERDKLDRPPPSASYRDSPEWLGGDAKKPRDRPPSKRKVIDLDE